VLEIGNTGSRTARAHETCPLPRLAGNGWGIGRTSSSGGITQPVCQFHERWYYSMLYVYSTPTSETRHTHHCTAQEGSFFHLTGIYLLSTRGTAWVEPPCYNTADTGRAGGVCDIVVLLAVRAL